MAPRAKLTGQKFHSLQVIAEAGVEGGRSLWLCLCDCGAEAKVSGKSLTSGNTRSCGCLQKEARLANGRKNIKHGHAKSGSKPSSRTYNSWFSMKSRCERETDRMHPMYGGVGITVCERWQTFGNFLADMGERPEGTTLDRIDGTKGYSKENCQWATPKEQGQNRKNTRKFPYEGKALTITEVADRWGVPREQVKYHLSEKGRSVAELVRDLKEFK